MSNVLWRLRNEYEATVNNGNLKSQTIQPLGRKQSFTYGAKNRLDSAQETPAGGGAASWSQTFGYDYDAFGQRVRSVANGKTTHFVYDALGRLTAEYEPGQTPTLQKRYVVQDQLGSTRLVTNASGGVMLRSDYLPYGEEIPSSVGGRTLLGYGSDAGVKQGFTGKERDGETGLDSFGARHYSGALGRFLSADLPLYDQDTADPLSWNLFSYVRNNPLRYIDPTGRGCVSTQSGHTSTGIPLWTNTNDPRVPGPSCGEIDKADRRLTPTVTVTGQSGSTAELSAQGQQFYNEMSRRRDASNQMIAAFAVGSASVGVAVGGFVTATELSGGSGLTTIMTGGEAIGVEGLGAEEVALVSRWGRPGLQPGDWVMSGGRTASNYLRSFKWEPSNVFTKVGNQFTKFTQGDTFLVPKSAVQKPSGWEAFKQVFGQRMFKP